MYLFRILSCQLVLWWINSSLLLVKTQNKNHQICGAWAQVDFPASVGKSRCRLLLPSEINHYLRPEKLGRSYSYSLLFKVLLRVYIFVSEFSRNFCSASNLSYMTDKTLLFVKMTLPVPIISIHTDVLLRMPELRFANYSR